MSKFASLIYCLAMLSQPQLLNAQTKTTRGGEVRVRSADGQTYNVQLYKRSYALLIGNNDYAYWGDLPGVRQDMNEVKRALKRQGFEIVCFDQQGAVLRDQPALNLTREEFNRQVELFVNEYGQEGSNQLMLYYAGHGYTALLPDNRKMGYLVMRDAPRMPPVEDDLPPSLSYQQLTSFRRTSVNMDEVKTFAKNITARHALFVFDSCFGGTVLFRGETKIPSYISMEVLEPVREFLTAGNEIQKVMDDGMFRRAFVHGLQGAADAAYGGSPPDGYVLGSELAAYVRQEVSKYTENRQTPTFGKIFEPELARGDFVFTVNPTREVAAELQPPAVEVSRAPRIEPIVPAPVNYGGRGLNLGLYCQKLYGLASAATFTEGDAYSWRCLNRGTNQRENFYQMNLVNACAEQYGADYGPMINDLREARSWVCTETFIFDYHYGSNQGVRKWFRKDAQNWVEQLSDGTTNCFKVVGEASVSGVNGSIIRNCNEGYELFIPDIPRRGKSILLRLDSYQRWAFLQVIK